MSRTKFKSKVAHPADVCGERFACPTDKETPSFYCCQCDTYQCSACAEELHKEGDSFFHELQSLAKLRTSIDALGGDLSVTIDSSRKPTAVGDNLAHNIPFKQASNLGRQSSKPHSRSLPQDKVPKTKKSPTAHFADASTVLQINNIDAVKTVSDLGEPLVFDDTRFELKQTPSEESESDSGEFHSLGLDSILDSELAYAEMKGQSSKSSKKSKAKKSCSSLIQESASKEEPKASSEEFVSTLYSNDELKAATVDLADDSPPNDFRPMSIDHGEDEELVSNLMKSVRSESLHSPNNGARPLNNHSTSRVVKSSPSLSETVCGTPTTSRSFLLIDESETIQVSCTIAYLCHSAVLR